MLRGKCDGIFIIFVVLGSGAGTGTGTGKDPSVSSQATTGMSELGTIHVCDGNISQSGRLTISFESVNTTFRTRESRPSCASQVVVVSENKTLGIGIELIDPKGILLLRNDTLSGTRRFDYFYPQEYCISQIRAVADKDKGDVAIAIAVGDISIRVCPPSCTGKYPCIRKCCQHTEALHITKQLVKAEEVGEEDEYDYFYECKTSTEVGIGNGNEHEVDLHHDIDTPLNATEKNEISPHYFVEDFNCKKNLQFSVNSMSNDGESADSIEIVRFRTLKDGRGGVYHNSHKPLQGFCTHHLDRGNEEYSKYEFGVLNCQTDVVEDGSETETGEDSSGTGHHSSGTGHHSSKYMIRIVMGRLMITLNVVSAFFFLLSSVVYLLLWKTQNVHGKIVAFHVISSFCMTLLFAIVFITNIFYDASVRTGNKAGCITLGALSHYFFLSSICWLTMINADLWWKFRVLSPAMQKAGERRRFVLYNIFAWGAPFLIVLVGLILNKSDGKDSGSGPKGPGYGWDHCYVVLEAQWEYIYGFLSTLFITNIIFFLWTVISIYMYKRDSLKNLRREKKSSQDEMLLVFIKLTTVMGFTWGLEILSHLLQKKFEPEGNVAGLIFVMIMDAVNLLRAIPIFLIFTCKRTVFAQLWFRHTWLRPVLLCVKHPMCLEALNRERSVSQVSTSRVTMSTVGKSAITNMQDKERVLYEDVPL